MAKIDFCFLSENECLDGMELAYIYIYIYNQKKDYTYIYIIFSESKTPSYRAFYILHFFKGSYFTSVIGVVCRDVTRGLLHGDLQQNQ